LEVNASTRAWQHWPTPTRTLGERFICCFGIAIAIVAFAGVARADPTLVALTESGAL
jgi:hypothetical protein